MMRDRQHHERLQAGSLRNSRLAICATRKASLTAALRIGNSTKAARAMTLMELLIVISIIGILSAVALPAIRGMKQSNVINAANRQLLDDLALARQFAIKNRSEVCVLFAPPIDNRPSIMPPPPPPEDPDPLILGQCVSYRLFARRTVGDQPGRPMARYLTGWRDLPGGVFIATNKFRLELPNDDPLTLPLWTIAGRMDMRTFQVEEFPYPSSTNGFRTKLCYIAFDPQGRLSSRDTTPDGRAIIPLARGGVLHGRDDNGYFWELADLKETPDGNSTNNHNFIVINALTGRARVERPEVQ